MAWGSKMERIAINERILSAAREESGDRESRSRFLLSSERPGCARCRVTPPPGLRRPGTQPDPALGDLGLGSHSHYERRERPAAILAVQLMRQGDPDNDARARGRQVTLTNDPGYLLRLGGQRRADGAGILRRAPVGEALTCARYRAAAASRQAHRGAQRYPVLPG